MQAPDGVLIALIGPISDIDLGLIVDWMPFAGLRELGIDRRIGSEVAMSSKKHELTATEKASIELDKKVMELVQRVVPPDPDGGVLPEGAIVAGDVEYWASGGNTAKVKEAINAGSDVNAASDGGYTALHAAAENGHVDVARILVESGADTTAKLESGQTPVDLARLAGKDEMLDYFRSIGAV